MGKKSKVQKQNAPREMPAELAQAYARYEKVWKSKSLIGSDQVKAFTWTVKAERVLVSPKSAQSGWHTE